MTSPDPTAGTVLGEDKQEPGATERRHGAVEPLPGAAHRSPSPADSLVAALARSRAFIALDPDEIQTRLRLAHAALEPSVESLLSTAREAGREEGREERDKAIRERDSLARRLGVRYEELQLERRVSEVLGAAIEEAHKDFVRMRAERGALQKQAPPDA